MYSVAAGGFCSNWQLGRFCKRSGMPLWYKHLQRNLHRLERRRIELWIVWK
jgi:membrane protein YqaA with SNARE-associated domain